MSRCRRRQRPPAPGRQPPAIVEANLSCRRPPLGCSDHVQPRGPDDDSYGRMVRAVLRARERSERERRRVDAQDEQRKRTLGYLIERMRNEARMSQAGLAKAIGTTQSSVSRWEAGPSSQLAFLEPHRAGDGVRSLGGCQRPRRLDRRIGERPIDRSRHACSGLPVR
jgi:DNA-binding XRE family transcriptional regulator